MNIFIYHVNIITYANVYFTQPKSKYMMAHLVFSVIISQFKISHLFHSADDTLGWIPFYLDNSGCLVTLQSATQQPGSFLW